MRIPSPEEVGREAVRAPMLRAQRAGLPVPGCLLAVEALRLAAGACLVAAVLATMPVGAQAVAFLAGAVVMSGSAVMLIPVYRSEWRAWGPDIADYYRARAGRIRDDGVGGRMAKVALALACTCVAFLAPEVSSMPQGLRIPGILVSLLLWIDVVSLYAACVEPIP